MMDRLDELLTLTPGFGGFTPVLHVTTGCRLTCADAHHFPRKRCSPKVTLEYCSYTICAHK
ncbi:UNVERIFIED_CONTAM: hypothetical protein DQE83_24980 [Escherichia coli]